MRTPINSEFIKSIEHLKQLTLKVRYSTADEFTELNSILTSYGFVWKNPVAYNRMSSKRYSQCITYALHLENGFIRAGMSSAYTIEFSEFKKFHVSMHDSGTPGTARYHGCQGMTIEDFKAGKFNHVIPFDTNDEAAEIQRILIDDFGLKWNSGTTEILQPPGNLKLIRITDGKMMWVVGDVLSHMNVLELKYLKIWQASIIKRRAETSLQPFDISRPKIEDFVSGKPFMYVIRFDNQKDAVEIQHILMDEFNLSWGNGSSDIIRPKYHSGILVSESAMHWSMLMSESGDHIWDLTKLKSYVNTIKGAEIHKKYSDIQDAVNNATLNHNTFKTATRTIIKIDSVKDVDKLIPILKDLDVTWLGGQRPPSFWYDSIFISHGSAAWYQLGRDRFHPTSVWSLEQLEAYHSIVIKTKGGENVVYPTSRVVTLNVMKSRDYTESDLLQSVGRIRRMKSEMRLGMNEQILLL